MSIKDSLTKDIAEATKAGEKLRLSTLRLVLSSVKNKEIELRRELTEEDFVEVVSTMAKQRRESIELYTRGGRDELAEKEAAELEILEEFLPEQLSEDEILSVIKDTAAELGATTIKEMGRLMGAVMPKLKGKADGKLVQSLARKVLGE